MLQESNVNLNASFSHSLFQYFQKNGWTTVHLEWSGEEIEITMGGK